MDEIRHRGVDRYRLDNFEDILDGLESKSYQRAFSALGELTEVIKREKDFHIFIRSHGLFALLCFNFKIEQW